jgi:hypothetical protein
MRIFLGLLLFAAVVNGETVTLTAASTATTGSSVSYLQAGLFISTAANVGSVTPTSSTGNVANTCIGCLTLPANNGGSYNVQLTSKQTSVVFAVTTSPSVAQLMFRSSPSFTTYCDPCSTASQTTSTSLITASTTQSPVPNVCSTSPSAAPSYTCGNVNRAYTYGSIVAGDVFQFSLYASGSLTVTSITFSFSVSTGSVVGDPQIVGMQGQDFQVHGMPDEIFNIVTYPTVQVNARFTYLESADCHDNFTACFAHPGTYISEEGFRLGKDKIRITAGSFKSGLTVHVNGKLTKHNTDLRTGAVELVNHRRVIIHTDIMKFSVSNSDKFLNQEIELKDDKLVALGAERRQLKDNQRFHPEVPLHGLQGQTWRNVEYASGLEYEGSIMDYHVVDGNLYGTDFVFNQFQTL